MLTRARQSIVQSFRQDADLPYADQVTVGTIGGGALPTDPNPNTTPPPASRVLRLTPRGPSLTLQTTNATLTVLSGTSVTVQVWFFDDTQARWIQLGAPFASTTVSIIVAAVLGAKLFPQITANTGVEVILYGVY
jgi:hypothetical protein